jgi:hypothetical protein
MSKNYPSYRALMEQDDILRIPLSNMTQPEQGYKIRKLQIMPNDVDGSTSHECAIQVFLKNPGLARVDINFSDDTLLAAAYYARSAQGSSPYVIDSATESVIFDNTVFNQDIYVTYGTGQSGQKINFYLELEEVTMSKAEQAVVNFNAVLLHG